LSPNGFLAFKYTQDPGLHQDLFLKERMSVGVFLKNGKSSQGMCRLAPLNPPVLEEDRGIKLWQDCIRIYNILEGKD